MGGYRILRTLGQGGMGAVYEAEEVETGRHVALKILRGGLDSPVARQRFRREGLLAASVNHPNTVYVFGTDEIDGQPVILMELVRGGTLQDRVAQNGPMTAVDAVDAILQVIAGLECAAALGMLHRDIKPSNCFVEMDGTIKVGDFGLSISSSEGGESKLTMAGSFLGTPAFSPPEQLRGDAFTVQGDLYSVGVTLYYLLTGRTPFEGGDLVRMLATVLERPAPSPDEFRPELPKGLCTVVLRCLEKQPAKRFKGYSELRNALLPFSSTAPSPAALSVRFLAGLIDWVLLFAGSTLMTLFWSGSWDVIFHPSLHPQERFPIQVVSVALGFLYYATLEGLWGASIGKRICGLWVTGPVRGLAGVPRALVRALIVVGITSLPDLLFLFLLQLPGNPPPSWIPSCGLVLLALLFVSARRSNGFAAIQDMVSRTRVVRRPSHQYRPEFESMAARPSPAEDAAHFGPYQVLESLGSSGEEKWFLCLDKPLRRNVWIRKLPPEALPVTPALRTVARVGRLRWLAGRRSGEDCWDAYEAVPGRPFHELVNRRQPWNRVRFWLMDLAEELTAAAKESSLPECLGLDRIWITTDGRAKLLDFRAPDGDARHDRAEAAMEALSSTGSGPELFLKQVAVTALEGRPIATTDALPASVAIPLPIHARQFLGELQSGLSPSRLVDRLKPLLSRLGFVSRQRRLALIAGCMALPLTFSVIGIAVVLFSPALEWAFVTQGFSNAAELGQCLNRLGELNTKQKSAGQLSVSEGADVLAKQNREREAFEIYVVGRFRQAITNPVTWTSIAGASIPPERRAVAQGLLAARPPPTDLELNQATEVVESYLKSKASGGLVTPLASKLVTQVYVSACALLFVAVQSLIAAFTVRGGLVLRALDLTIVKNDGAPASRLRIFCRGLIAWCPALLLPTLMAWWVPLFGAMSWRHAAVTILGVLFFLMLIIWAALLPDRGLQDRLAGTCLVPRG